MWGCDSYKSLGPAGVSFDFIKDFWDILKEDLLRFMVEFHRQGKLTKSVNSTFITMILKVDRDQRVVDFWPILLVSCLYKVLAKAVANRLRKVIGGLISDTQSAFIFGRFFYGILIANEVEEDAQKNKKELLLLKVDFEKAYDSVDWNFLKRVMT